MATQPKSLEIAFGQRLRLKRNKCGLSQEELAHRSGLHRTYVSQIERGLKSPSLSTIYALAAALDEDAGVLISALIAKRGSRRQ
ncbi:helix-turn-helix transcriptional regulator [Bradyrhizobium sp. SZCCHNR1045]|uniref:helix-turn-helix domain-containing protein n=1 Tax=Bradyrhizobium sp. SZCCHNR1045 TaxID=3057353 RepID=UPI002915F057|nr:helix-turn-helix transcriptional regulator [Bradyrhizobium sp. SZCCHNR1045]